MLAIDKQLPLPAVFIECSADALSHVGAPLSIVLRVISPYIDSMAPHLVLLHVPAVVAAVFIRDLSCACAYVYGSSKLVHCVEFIC